MKQVAAIAVNTFKETIRDRVLAVIVVFALIMIVGGLWLGSISLGEQGRMMKDFGLVAVTFFGLIVAVFVAAGPGAQGGREAHGVRALLEAGEPRRRSSPASSSGSVRTMAVVLAGMGALPVRAGVGGGRRRVGHDPRRRRS